MRFSHGQRLRVEVIDTGVGISGDNLTRIFSHGFTTKKNGQGFGLYSSALAHAAEGLMNPVRQRQVTLTP